MIYPKNAYKYTANFLHMLFSHPYDDYPLKPHELIRDLLSILDNLHNSCFKNIRYLLCICTVI